MASRSALFDSGHSTTRRVAIDSQGNWIADSDSRKRLAWSPQDGLTLSNTPLRPLHYLPLTYNGTVQEPHLQLVDVFWPELFDELRSGLTHTQWFDETPWARGHDWRGSTRDRWARVALPFEWAQEAEVFVAISEGTGQLRFVAIYLGSQDRFKAVFRSNDWHASVTPADLNPVAPNEPPPLDHLCGEEVEIDCLH